MKLLIFLTIFSLSNCIDCYSYCLLVPITADQNTCFRNCDQKFIIIYTIVGVLIFLLLICTVCCVRHSRFCDNTTKYLLQLRKEKDTPTVPYRNFIQQKNLFLGAARSLLPTFYIMRGLKQSFFEVKELIDKQEEEGLFSIEIQGSDEIDEFQAKGSILSGENGRIMVWLLMWYVHETAAKKANVSEYVLMEGTLNGQYVFSGKWNTYGEGEQRDGKWGLIVRQPDKQGRNIDVGSMGAINSC